MATSSLDQNIALAQKSLSNTTGITYTPDHPLNQMLKVTRLLLRPMGRHGNYADYQIIDYSRTRKNPDELGERLFGIMEVREDVQTVRVMHVCGTLMFQTHGGLYQWEETMNVLLRVPGTPDGFVGQIDSKEIKDENETSQGKRMYLRYPFAVQTYGNAARFKVLYREDDENDENPIGYYCSHYNYVRVFYPRDDVDITKKGLMMLFMLKLFYGVYNLHQEIMPVGTLYRMPPELPTPPVQDLLKNATKLLLRQAFVTKHNVYCDVLSGSTREILLVIAIHRDFSMHVFNRCGELQYETRDIQREFFNETAIYTHQGLKLGKIYSYHGSDQWEYYEEGQRIATMKEAYLNATVKHQGYGVINVETNDTDRKELATYYVTSRDKVVAVKFLQANVSFEKMILLLVGGFQKAQRYYQMSEAPYPTVRKYPFKAIL